MREKKREIYKKGMKKKISRRVSIKATILYYFQTAPKERTSVTDRIFIFLLLQIPQKGTISNDTET